jgi:hypothetical protein
MAIPGGTDLLLFVAGLPDSGEDPFRDVRSPFLGMFVGSGRWLGQRRPAAVGTSEGSPTLSTGAPRMRLPADQVQCVREAARIAEQAGRKLLVVDVNQAAGYQELVTRWVGPNDVFPFLVRPDGARLVGDEQFHPARLRSFMARR